MKKEILLILLLLTAYSCKLDDAEYLDRDELGAVDKEFTVGSDIGRLEFSVYANKSGRVNVLEGGEWLSAATKTFDHDATICLDYLYNEGFQRLGMVELSTDTRRDTVIVKQKGAIEESLDFPQTGIVVYNGSGASVLPVEGNVDLKNVSHSVVYIDGENWISSVSLRQGQLELKTADNPDPRNVRRARIRLSYTDGWKNERVFTIQVTQAPSGNIIGELQTFPQIREMATTGGSLITDDYCIEGFVVSRPESGNVGENAVLAMNYIDYAADEETAYVESLDGKYGFRVRTASPEDNVLRPESFVRILLNGATVQKEENPSRYSIYGVTASMLLESKAGEIPVKSMHMSELTDDDIYTYVTLTDCEIPVRKGCLTPVNEGYTSLFNSDRVSKFPILIRDIEGSSMYMYTNTTCPYRRDGRKLPYGKGRISGVIVHENYRSFIDRDDEDEDLCGNIGDYQIRHMRYEDLDLEDDISDSFSALLTEYRYMNIPADNPDHVWLPTYGDNGYFTHSRTSYIQSTYKTHGWPSTDFTYLGPCGKNYTTSENGYGITLDDGSDYGAEYRGNSTGKGVSATEMKLCWANTQWWFNGRGEAWIIAFSTKDIVSDVVSMQLSTQNISQSLRTPRYWKAEWSLSCDMSASADDQWHLIARYVVPDVGINSNTLPSQSLGFKQMDFPLPADEILGHEQVYIRLMPCENKASSGNDYDSSTIVNGNGNAINYFAIRYNKQ
ncbi:MAG: hypothetical protein IKR69_02265 [Bacteroidales bacterium]|nr:hypothetical protein [Bacteroidales bacterium]